MHIANPINCSFYSLDALFQLATASIQTSDNSVSYDACASRTHNKITLTKTVARSKSLHSRQTVAFLKEKSTKELDRTGRRNPSLLASYAKTLTILDIRQGHTRESQRRKGMFVLSEARQ